MLELGGSWVPSPLASFQASWQSLVYPLRPGDGVEASRGGITWRGGPKEMPKPELRTAARAGRREPHSRVSTVMGLRGCSESASGSSPESSRGPAAACCPPPAPTPGLGACLGDTGPVAPPHPQDGLACPEASLSLLKAKVDLCTQSWKFPWPSLLSSKAQAQARAHASQSTSPSSSWSLKWASTALAGKVR